MLIQNLRKTVFTCIYGTILVSCICHNVENVKERWNAGCFMPKCLRCEIRGKVLQQNLDFYDPDWQTLLGIRPVAEPSSTRVIQ